MYHVTNFAPMSKRPPVHESDFLKLTRNHGELTSKLTAIGIAAPDILEYAKYIGQCWFKLAEEHLAEARKAHAGECLRALFSRAYYSMYNASKAVRYIVHGSVSLKGDDHKRASADLPDDLPNVARWSQQLTLLYEDRLRADYDNWSDTQASNSFDPAGSIAIATEFLEEVRAYINAKYGMGL
jgi:hypothetical protein